MALKDKQVMSLVMENLRTIRLKRILVAKYSIKNSVYPLL